MISIFFYLTYHTMRNRLVRRLQRLREPRYALGLLAGLAYFYFFIIRHQSRRPGFGPEMLAAPNLRPYLEIALAALAGSMLLVTWLWPVHRSPLEFTQAEVQFLFTAPISRRNLIHYKLLRVQLGILSGSLIASFFMGRLNNPAHWPTVLGMWVLFATLHLHLIIAGFAHHSIAEQTHPNRWRLLIVFWAAALVGTVWMALQPVFAATSWLEGRQALMSASQQFPLKALLWPFRILTAPLLAPTPGAVALALPSAVVLLLLHYFGAVRFRAAFEEMAAEAAERKARARQLRRGGHAVVIGAKRRAPFELGPLGLPEVAFLWKNLVQLGRFWSVKTFVVVVILNAIVLGAGAALGAKGTVTIVVFAGVGFVAVTLLGPQIFRNDLRRDLLNLEVIKTYPLAGRQIVRGEILAPWFCLVVQQWVLLAILWMARLSVAMPGFQKIAGLWIFLGALVFAPAISLLGLLIQNAVALYFPGWISPGSHRSRGIESMGQQIVLMIAHLVSLVLLLLPALMAAALSGGAVYWIAGWPGITAGAVVATGVVFAEVWFGTYWLGHLFERTDPRQVESSEE
jgi:ABC-2 type transport system permease protein